MKIVNFPKINHVISPWSKMLLTSTKGIWEWGPKLTRHKHFGFSVFVGEMHSHPLLLQKQIKIQFFFNLNLFLPLRSLRWTLFVPCCRIFEIPSFPFMASSSPTHLSLSLDPSSSSSTSLLNLQRTVCVVKSLPFLFILRNLIVGLLHFDSDLRF